MLPMRYPLAHANFYAVEIHVKIGVARLVHNHPSGDPTPSRADIDMTCKLKDAATAVGPTLHDLLIVARGGHTSFKSQGLI